MRRQKLELEVWHRHKCGNIPFPGGGKSSLNSLTCDCLTYIYSLIDTTVRSMSSTDKLSRLEKTKSQLLLDSRRGFPLFSEDYISLPNHVKCGYESPFRSFVDLADEKHFHVMLHRIYFGIIDS